jgi:hypothetical protein
MCAASSPTESLEITGNENDSNYFIFNLEKRMDLEGFLVRKRNLKSQMKGRDRCPCIE